VIFGMFIKVEAEIRSFDYSVAMRSEVETNTRREIRGLALNNEFIVDTIIISQGPADVYSRSFGVEFYLFSQRNCTLITR